MAPSRMESGVQTLLSGTIWMIIVLLFMVSETNADKTAADYYVKSLPGAPDGPLLKMHAG